ncbi:hypothetical protein [Nocardioides sambongensis]|uniref:hypothetical protein n=1 Tax=Nocardioides sambongensis TaxID=2589074 RepID=UPI0011266471|nr:hypothetical protein [Nocardioides sambongensis]
MHRSHHRGPTRRVQQPTPAQTNPFRDDPTAGAVVHALRTALHNAHEHQTRHPTNAQSNDQRSDRAVRLPTLEELTTEHPNPVVEHWRTAARAAALAEHDIGGTDTHGTLTTPQAQALVGDVATITQALVVLDRRYHRAPGWPTLTNPHQLGWTALASALDTSLGQPDYTIDDLGWRPHARLMRGPAKPGLLGVLQAEHNLLYTLKALPTATDLRLIVDSQRRVSSALAALAVPVGQRLHDTFTQRAGTYADLHRALRDIGGLLGHGSAAVAQAATLTARTKNLTGHETVEPRRLAAFHTLFARFDARVAEIVEQAVAGGTFLQRTTLDQLEPTGGPVHRPRERYTPINDPATVEAVKIVREQLRPETSPPAVRDSHDPSRAALGTALTRRLGQTAPPVPGM